MWSILHVFLPIVDSENSTSLESPGRESQPFASKIANVRPKSHARTAPVPAHGHPTWLGRFVRPHIVPGRVAPAACAREVPFTPLPRLRVHRKNVWFCRTAPHTGAWHGARAQCCSLTARGLPTRCCACLAFGWRHACSTQCAVVSHILRPATSGNVGPVHVCRVRAPARASQHAHRNQKYLREFLFVLKSTGGRRHALMQTRQLTTKCVPRLAGEELVRSLLASRDVHVHVASTLASNGL
jgi:hypothetical protein